MARRSPVSVAAGEGAPPAGDSAALAIAICSYAQEVLAGGDLAVHRGLFEQLVSIEDLQRRHWAGIRMIEQLLALSSTASPARLPALFEALASGALTMLEHEPRETMLLNSAGVALYELWSLDAASAMFKAAKRLDPRLAQVDRNLAALAQRRRLMRGA